MKKKVISKKKSFAIHFPKKLILVLIVLALLFAPLYIFVLHDLPSPSKLPVASRPLSTKIYDRNNTLLYTIYADKNQSFVPLKDIPKSVQQATIAIEDKNFYRHGAIDIRGVARATYATIFKKDLQGGSTLTQQLIKTSLLTPERTVQRKVKEIFLSFVTEIFYDKDEILEMYLNQVPYGGTAYGIEAASQTYFGKGVKQLTIAESALLVGLPESPTTYSPFGSYPDLARERQEEILIAMKDQKYINQKQFDEAMKQEIVYKKNTNPIRAPHFVLYIKDLLVKKYGVKTVEQGGLTVKTSLDLKTQDFAQATVASEVATLTNYNVGNGAAVITRPGTGEILAMVGSIDYFNSETDGNVNVTLANRQPGSSIKPVAYATGLVKGYSAATLFVDKAVCFPSPGQKPYCPKNYDGKFHGVLQMRSALANSINTSAVQMVKLTGVNAMVATASAMGITSYTDPDRYGLSLALGGGEVKMIEMATAYGVFANSGYRIDLHPILKVTDNSGRVLEEYTPPDSPIFGKRVLPSGVAFIISDILADNSARAMAFGTNSQLFLGRNNKVSVKTGTTNDYRDNWTIGYTPAFTIATWVGNNDNKPMNNLVSGVTGAAPIWNKLARYMLENYPREEFVKPDDVIQKSFCTGSAATPEEKCPSRNEYFLKNAPAPKINSARQKVFIDKTTRDLAAPGQTENIEEKEELIITDPLGNKFCASCVISSPTP